MRLKLTALLFPTMFFIKYDYVCSTTKLNTIQYCSVQFSIDCLFNGNCVCLSNAYLEFISVTRDSGFTFFCGLFYSVNAIIGIILSQILAKYSDKQDDRRKSDDCLLFDCCAWMPDFLLIAEIIMC